MCLQLNHANKRCPWPSSHKALALYKFRSFPFSFIFFHALLLRALEHKLEEFLASWSIQMCTASLTANHNKKKQHIDIARWTESENLRLLISFQLRFSLQNACETANSQRMLFIAWKKITQIAKFMGPTWGLPGSCRPQMGPILAPLTLPSGYFRFCIQHCACWKRSTA